MPINVIFRNSLYIVFPHTLSISYFAHLLCFSPDFNIVIHCVKTMQLVKLCIILALKVILLDRLQGINCSGIQEP